MGSEPDRPGMAAPTGRMKIWNPEGTANAEEAAAVSAAWMSAMLLAALGSAEGAAAAAGGPPRWRDHSLPNGTIAITPGASCSALQRRVSP